MHHGFEKAPLSLASMIKRGWEEQIERSTLSSEFEYDTTSTKCGVWGDASVAPRRPWVFSKSTKQSNSLKKGSKI